VDEAFLQLACAEINRQFFDGSLPPCRVVWSRRLTRSAGNINVRSRVIKLSVPLIIDAFGGEREHEVPGVVCRDAAQAAREILKHELIHLWLFERGLPHGHTAAFRAKARQMGQARTRHAIERPLPKTGWLYACAHCAAQIVRRKRWGRARACGACCKKFNGGRFDARFKLSGRRIPS
jgi:hypothetical protein